MFSNHLKSRFDEFVWKFQLRYLPFYSEWIFLLFPIILLITMPLWLPRVMFYFLRDKGVIVNLLASGFILIVISLIMYLYAIVGEPDQHKWKKQIIPMHIERIATKVRDVEGDVVGILANPNLKQSTKSTLYINHIPSLYWEILKDREETYLDFDNKETGFWGIINNPRSFNGVDPIGVPKSILLELRGGSSLTQQLVKNFYGQDYFNTLTSSYYLNTIIRKWTELNEAKTFYHNLRANDGEEFKRWVSMYSPPLVSNGTVYGLESVSAVIFGKKPQDLAEYEQVLLSQMHKIPYYFSEGVYEERCRLIKHESKLDINRYFADDQAKQNQLNQQIDGWVCPKHPQVPLDFYDILHSFNKNVAGNLSTRVWKLAGSSMVLLRDELKAYKEKFPKHLITETGMTIDTSKNFAFKKGITHALSSIETRLGQRLFVDLDGNITYEERPQANIWISVVNAKGEIVRIYQRGNVHDRRRIGSISKIFEAIALGHRGDKWNYLYCNEYFKGLGNADGDTGGTCNNQGASAISAKEVFGKSKNLPLKSAFDKYYIRDTKGVTLIHKPINSLMLNQLHTEFGLHRDNLDGDMEYEFSFGLINSTPLNIQKSMHMLSTLLYPTESYRDVHIIKSLQYKTIDDETFHDGGVKRDMYASKLSASLVLLFDANTKEYMRTVLKAPISHPGGTLRSFRSIKGYKTLFIKSGTSGTQKDGEDATQNKWVAGAVKVNGKNYSFVIMVDYQQGLGYKIAHHEMTRPLFKEIVKSLRQ